MATVGIVAATAISLSGLERSRQTRNMGITIGPLWNLRDSEKRLFT